MPPRRLELGFLSFIPNDYGSGNAARALQDGIRLFQHAERLGFDVGWVRVRHFEDFLSSPLTFLTAVGQRTTRIRLGTGVIPMRYEDPIRLAEDAATVDLLTGGRLELGISAGIAQLASILDPVFDQSESRRSFSDESQYRIGGLRDALAGAPVAHSGKGFMSIPADKDLTVTPMARGLADRVWYGPGTLASARRTGEQGLDIHVSTLNSEETGDSFATAQAKQLRAYKEAFNESEAAERRAPRIAAGRIILPFFSEEDQEAYAGFIKGYDERMAPDGRPHDPKLPMRFDRVHFGNPAHIVESLENDVALREATELTVTLPAPGGIDAHMRTLEAVARYIAPQLGWSPAR
jgi:alkanesulfonate monooxygenase SsuD/methylene tetrahydromethanopterin reductase-like flavin-dependent oxidoreductase (luciferase family)